MTCRARLASIRLMNQMERMNQGGNTCVNKAEDGTMQYINNNGDVLVEAKMVKRTEA